MTGIVSYAAAVLYTVVITNWDAPIVQPYLRDPVAQHLEQYSPPSKRPAVYQNGLIVEQTFDSEGRLVGTKNVDIVTRSGKSVNGRIEWTYFYYHVDFEAIDRFMEQTYNRRRQYGTRPKEAYKR